MFPPTFNLISHCKIYVISSSFVMLWRFDSYAYYELLLLKVMNFPSFYHAWLSFVRVCAKISMKDSKEDIDVGDEYVVFDLDPREISRGFAFPTVLLMNSVDVGDFTQIQKDQTYIRVHRRDFGYDHTDNKVI